MANEHDHCANCGADVTALGVSYFCDEDENGPYCGECFDKHACGKGEHGEGCATMVVEAK
jgi:hypothetical protein